MEIKKTTLLVLLFMSFALSAFGQAEKVVVQNDNGSWTLLVDGRPTMINGMNWDYFPRGTNYSYSLWDQSPALIKEALDYEMGLLQYMGVNAIRVYTGIPKEWITYIYKNYGIYTMLNHSFGRYGLTLDGAWVANTEYSDPRVEKLLLAEVTQLTIDYKDTPGLLLYLLGNENNYGLFWGGAETEDIPIQDRKSTERARHMYKLFNKAAVAMKAIDTGHPIALCNGDVLFLDIIAKEAKDVDIFGTNVYRGLSFTDLYDKVKNEYGKPVLLTEFGSDAFNARTTQEDQLAQAYYQKGNWKEIYQNAAGLGQAGNSLGGFTFQFTDGWWKYGQTDNLDVHDANASWANGGYSFDFVDGENNMNEEWFGIAAKGPTKSSGLYEVFPRAAYYVLQEVHKFNPYALGVDRNALEAHFSSISLQGSLLRARGDKAAMGEDGSKIKLSRFTADFNTYSTGATLTTTPESPVPNSRDVPNQTGFDHMQSFFFGIEAQPSPNMRASVDLNVLGNVAQNPIDELFYESRGAPVTVQGVGEPVTLRDINRVSIYQAEYFWDYDYFKVDGFYRTGHYHWQDEGDFFGLYPEANYGPNIDIYGGNAPLGMEIEGKKQFSGLKVAFGPELWWGANPAVLVKYQKNIGQTELSGMFHEDLQQAGATASSIAIPQPKTRRMTLAAQRDFGKIRVNVGGIWGGQPLNGRTFQLAREEADGSVSVYQDEIGAEDNWGGKLKLTYFGGLFNWYASSAVQGLVANGGADATITHTGWRLKDSGSGNQYNALTGFTYTLGKLQIAPNFLWQKPIEGPVPGDSGVPGARPRNILTDPFVVRANREQIAGELLITFDPTPGSFMYEWDSDRREDAEFAVSLGIVYRHLPTIQDAAIGILPDGRTFFPFEGSAPAQDLWEVNARIVSKLSRDLGFIVLFYGGDAQANGSDPRLITRFGGDLRMIHKKSKLNTTVKINDWGPFDYHRDFNLTFPLQLMADYSTTLGKQDWFNMPTTRMGIRATWRSLDRYSPRFAPVVNGQVVADPFNSTLPFPDNGTEWELRTYIQINIRN